VGRGKTKGEDWFDRDRDVNVKNYTGLGSYIILYFLSYRYNIHDFKFKYIYNLF
jgi:hypothetical protein